MNRPVNYLENAKELSDTSGSRLGQSRDSDPLVKGQYFV